MSNTVNSSFRQEAQTVQTGSESGGPNNPQWAQSRRSSSSAIGNQGAQPKGRSPLAIGSQGVQPKRSGSLAIGSQWGPGLVRKLFDKEVDNNHEEALLLAQLAAHQLTQALQNHPSSDLADRVVVWAEAAVQVSLSQVAY